MRASEERSPFSNCRLCPRDCGVDRTSGGGFCRERAGLRVAVANLHFGEEPPISGETGSGTVFFSGCTLRCSFCQNHQLSSGELGREITTEELCAIFLELERRGAHTINLVTATHFTPLVSEAVVSAKARGLSLPIVWNSSGYERVETLESLRGVVDIYLPDVKTLDVDIAIRLFRAGDYPERAVEAVRRMVEAAPLRGNADPAAGPMTMSAGVIVRHLVLPGRLDATRRVLEWYAAEIGSRALLSLMVQYLPMPGDDLGPRSVVGPDEYDAVLSLLDDFGIDDGFVQEPEEQSPWIPDFTRVNPFPPDHSRPVWHWKAGFVGTEAGFDGGPPAAQHDR